MYLHYRKCKIYLIWFYRSPGKSNLLSSSSLVTKYILIWLSCLICEQYKYWSDILSILSMMASSLDTHGRSRNRSPWFPGTLCRRPLWTAVLTYTYRAGTPAVTADRSLCWPLSSLWTASGSPKSEEENGILKHHIPILWSCSVHKLLGDDEYHFFSNNKNFALKMHLHVHVLANAQDNAIYRHTAKAEICKPNMVSKYVKWTFYMYIFIFRFMVNLAAYSGSYLSLPLYTSDFNLLERNH